MLLELDTKALKEVKERVKDSGRIELMQDLIGTVYTSSAEPDTEITLIALEAYNIREERGVYCIFKLPKESKLGEEAIMLRGSWLKAVIDSGISSEEVYSHRYLIVNSDMIDHLLKKTGQSKK